MTGHVTYLQLLQELGNWTYLQRLTLPLVRPYHILCCLIRICSDRGQLLTDNTTSSRMSLSIPVAEAHQLLYFHTYLL